MLAALARLVEQRPKPTPSILMACTINEEHGFTGATALAETWKSPGAGPFERRPDAAIVAEPTMLDVVAAHKGVVRWRCHTSGRAVHSSRPELGQNAIYAMAPVVAALEAYQREAVPTLGEHARCGRASLSVGVIGGGISVNTVPDRCTIQIDYRLLPDADPLAAQQEVIRYVAERHPSPERVLHDEPYMASGGLHDDQNASLAERVRRSAASVHPGCKSIGVPYGTDASVFCAAGVPTVVVGPGDIAQAHTADEFLEIDQLRRATEFYYQLACGE
jgi:acetylornithine deacetylase